jgi:hypothetical protein
MKFLNSIGNSILNYISIITTVFFSFIFGIIGGSLVVIYKGKIWNLVIILHLSIFYRAKIFNFF